MIHLPDGINAFEFVVVASLRAVQLTAGCTPRVPAGIRPVVTAQHEVAEGKVTPLPRDEGRRRASEPVRRGASAPTPAEELQELLHALKRRVPRTGRAEEAAIARDSAELADVATERLKTLAAPAARAR
jgi:DNA-directed RNA polymerase subunit K/omega